MMTFLGSLLAAVAMGQGPRVTIAGRGLETRAQQAICRS
jgi:hypothetical protein